MNDVPDDQGPPGGAGGPSVGSVAEETARLLRALGVQNARTAADSPTDAPSGAGSASDRHTDTEAPCGHPGEHVPMGQALTCSLCPVCQGIAVLRTLSPQTLDRFAELASLAAATLRDLATQAQQQVADPPAAAPRSTPRRESIVITDEDDDLEGAQ